jgi:hypothetical protein
MDLPFPLLFNTWKHHAAALKERIAGHAGRGEAGLRVLSDELIVIGAQLMDLYVGGYSPAEVGRLILNQLARNGRLDRAAYCSWVEEGGGYRMMNLPDDSGWVLRLGDEDSRYVHLHPGRWVPQTRRVRANVLKTAVMVLAHAAASGDNPLDRAVVNRVRKEYLGLAPVGWLDGDQGLGEMIGLLRLTP